MRQLTIAVVTGHFFDPSVFWRKATSVSYGELRYLSRRCNQGEDSKQKARSTAATHASNFEVSCNDQVKMLDDGNYLVGCTITEAVVSLVEDARLHKIPDE